MFTVNCLRFIYTAPSSGNDINLPRNLQFHRLLYNSNRCLSFTLTLWRKEKKSECQTRRLHEVFCLWQTRRARVSFKVLLKKKKTRWRQRDNRRTEARGSWLWAEQREWKKKSAAVMWWWGGGGEKAESQTLAALQFVALLAISGGRDADVHHVVAWRLVVRRSVCYLLLRHDAVDFCNDNNNNKNTCMDCWKQDLRVFILFLTQSRHALLTEVRKTFVNAAL